MERYPFRRLRRGLREGFFYPRVNAPFVPWLKPWAYPAMDAVTAPECRPFSAGGHMDSFGRVRVSICPSSSVPGSNELYRLHLSMNGKLRYSDSSTCELDELKMAAGGEESCCAMT